MSTISIIILIAMLLSVVASLIVLFSSKRTTRVMVVPSYKDSVKKILNEKYKNNGDRLAQKQLLDNTDYVLNAF